ncbi:MAG TPA: tetratricopeptide repeat-containing protein [Polyangiaceae bacterium]|nr:tetratricopeptide repeat-containing protein [Polyangiaceae bacterium]
MPVIKPHKPHVFVVMPYGTREVAAADGNRPARRVDFDAVYRLLLQPALASAGCEPFRADEEPAAGDIRTDMFFELVTADFVLADISILNPNVFYELGVRQGVAPRGVMLVHGGHSKRPFDIVTDRTFGYDGALFVDPIAEQTLTLIKSAAATLATTIQNVMREDARTESSPVYKELPGLKAPDPRDIKNARARHFDAIFEGIADRLAVALKRGLAGDIVTLAEEAPNALYRARLLTQAGRALLDLQHFQLSLELLSEALDLNPNDADAESCIGIALNRLGRSEEAEVRIQRLTRRLRGHNDGQGALGRVYKDQWRQRWEVLATVEERREAAANYAEIAERAIESYAGALRGDQRSYYNGINALALAKLLELVNRPTRLSQAITAAQQLVSIVAEQRIEDTRVAQDESGRSEYVWALATRGELALLAGDAGGAHEFYNRAATSPGVTPFALDSMLRQLQMYEDLGFQPAATQRVREALELGRKLPSPLQLRKNVLFASGHMIDGEDRSQPRFPRGKEAAVRQQIEATLEKWALGPADLAICGGARGTDLLVAEACLQRDCPVLLLIANDEKEHRNEAVALPNSDWLERYLAVKTHRLTTTRFQSVELGKTRSGASAHERNNRWCMNTAWATARTRANVFVLLVWDEQQTGDGPGGTSHAASLAGEYAGKLSIINPTKI